MSTKLIERITEIINYHWSDEDKVKQIAGAIASQATRDSVQGENNYRAGRHEETHWPTANPLDLPASSNHEPDYD